MRGFINLVVLGALAFWLGPPLWSRLPESDRQQIRISLDQIRGESSHFFQQIASQRGLGVPVQNNILMEPGLWSVNAEINMSGRIMANSETQCITPAKIQEIMSSGGQGLIQTPNGGNCQ